jgi:hypothetical protein
MTVEIPDQFTRLLPFEWTRSRAAFLSFKVSGLLNATKTWMIQNLKNRQQLQTASLAKFIPWHRGGFFVIKSQSGRRVHQLVFDYRPDC